VMSVPEEDPLSGTDAIQAALMDERCLVVDTEDRVLGIDTKKNTHLMKNIRQGLLHRAFSVFLFSSEGKLLLQQRAAEKITFPLYWTNTVCSHPIYFVPEGFAPEPLSVDRIDLSAASQPETVEEEQLGVKRAARRKLEHELGIPQSLIDLSDFEYMCRIHYVGQSDETWGEHEIDYILILQKDLPLSPNPNEVASTRYVSLEELNELVATAEHNHIKLTPWFRLVSVLGLDTWWKNLGALDHLKNHSTIIRT